MEEKEGGREGRWAGCASDRRPADCLERVSCSLCSVQLGLGSPHPSEAGVEEGLAELEEGSQGGFSSHYPGQSSSVTSEEKSRW